MSRNPDTNTGLMHVHLSLLNLIWSQARADSGVLIICWKQAKRLDRTGFASSAQPHVHRRHGSGIYPLILFLKDFVK